MQDRGAVDIAINRLKMEAREALDARSEQACAAFAHDLVMTKVRFQLKKSARLLRDFVV
jgi:hypothetical protein